MKNTLLRLLALMLVLVMGCSALFACDNGSDDTDNTNQNQNNNENNEEDDELSKIPMGGKVGQRAITKELDLISGEGTVTISRFKGKVVVLNFWGTWCGPCRAELPEFNRIATEYSDSVAVVAVHTVFKAKSKAEAPQYIADNFPDSKIYFAYDKPYDSESDEYYTLLGSGEGYYPTTYIIDARGVITKVETGALSYDQLKSYVDAALAK